MGNDRGHEEEQEARQSGGEEFSNDAASSPLSETPSEEEWCADVPDTEFPDKKEPPCSPQPNHVTEKYGQPPPEEGLLHRHLRRQANILKCIVADKQEGLLSVSLLGEELERSLFNPRERKEKGENDPRLNFYPPFLTPECLALHYPFGTSVPIPRSCKANVGLPFYEDWKKELLSLPSGAPDAEALSWCDDLEPSARPLEEPKPEKLLIQLDTDTDRVRWFKTYAQQLARFNYPVLSLPPPVSKMLTAVFVGTPQDPNQLDKPYEPAFPDKFILEQAGGEANVQDIRRKLLIASTVQVTLLCLSRLFSRPSVVKNAQEGLHYTFGHGYVRMVDMLANVQLSEYVTYHGITHRNRLNHPLLHTTLCGRDKEDYLIDTVYLYLVFTWQTAMDIWQQMLDEASLTGMRQQLEALRGRLLRLPDAAQMAELLADTVFPPMVLDVFSSNLPDFINQAQLSAFRNFITQKSGVPSGVCPTLPSDLVPLTFGTSHPILWSHVLLLRYACFLVQHGDYVSAKQPKEVSLASCLCDCNLCSPHRMPCYNPSLLNEIFTIDKFDFRDDNPENPKQLKLTPQIFISGYLKKWEERDFFPDRVVFYKDQPEAFTAPLTAAVIKDDKLLALLRETQENRERELLKRGGGIYLDPKTGERIGPVAEPPPLRPPEPEEQQQTGPLVLPPKPAARPRLQLPDGSPSVSQTVPAASADGRSGGHSAPSAPQAQNRREESQPTLPVDERGGEGNGLEPQPSRRWRGGRRGGRQRRRSCRRGGLHGELGRGASDRGGRERGEQGAPTQKEEVAGASVQNMQESAEER